jgi:hypothetical protein
MKLPVIPADKANHMIYGSMIYFVCHFFMPPVIALATVAIVAAAKEVYDGYSKTGNAEINDFVATVIGALPLFYLH